ncbi:MAG: hypothetical protein ACTHJ0_09640 [Flavipsychrobacter sp.]
MKKLIPIAVIATFGILSFASCKKSSNDTGNYTCTCTFHNPFTGVDTSQSFTYSNAKKSDATNGCNANQTNLRQVDSAATCTLK